MIGVHGANVSCMNKLICSMNLKEWHRHYLESLKKIYAPGEASAITRLLFREMFKISTSDLICQAEKNMTAEEREKMQKLFAHL